MNLTSKELDMLIHAAGMIAEQSGDEKDALFMQRIADKLQGIKDYALPVALDPERKRRTRELLDMASATSTEYASYAGDMAMINEYDKIKKEAAAITDALGDVEGRLRADLEYAKKSLDSIFDRVKQDILDNGEVKSSTEAERKARIDDRYLAALSAYTDLARWAYVVKNKFNTIMKTREDAKQSVATARNSIIAEGYNS